MKFTIDKTGCLIVSDFEDIVENEGQVVEAFAGVIERLNIPDLKLKHFEKSLEHWYQDYKSNIHLKSGWNIYHPCGHNPLRFDVYYDRSKKTYIA